MRPARASDGPGPWAGGCEHSPLRLVLLRACGRDRSRARWVAWRRESRAKRAAAVNPGLLDALVKPILGQLKRIARDAVTLMRLPFAPPRRFDVCCCGLSKTGTHSMAGMFENYRSAHHPDADTRLRLAIAYLRGDLDVARAEQTLRRRDRLLQLEMESSSLAGILIEPMLRACPTKRFILTVREPYAWCDSWLDHNINSPPTPASLFGTLDRVRLRVDEFPMTTFDAPLAARGFPSLACFFQLWADHNSRGLRAVPADRLLVVRTADLTDKLTDIANWVGVRPETLRKDRAWLFAAVKQHGVLATLDASYVRDTIERFCGPVMKRHRLLFPPQVA